MSTDEGKQAMGRSRRLRSIRSAASVCLWLGVLAATALTGAMPARADDVPELTSLEKWQLRRLFVPNERELAHERQGNVYLYEGLTDRQVEYALDTHFDRIQYMLFLGTKRTDGNGKPLRNAEGISAKESADCGGP